jgi:hypothetical protein
MERLTGFLQDMINIMINMIFFLVILSNFGEDRQDFGPVSFSELAHG